MRKVGKMLLAACLCLPLFTACSPAKRTIAYSIYPIGWLLNVISGNTLSTVTVQSEEQPAVVQSAVLKSNYRDLLKSSKAFFHIGGLEPYLSVMGKTISDSGTDEEDLSSMNAVYNFNRYSAVIADGEKKYIESAYYEGKVFDNIDMMSKDLCFWNDPISMLSMAKNIRDWLQKTYPANADVYQNNYLKLQTELIDLDSKYQEYGAALSQKKQMISFVTVTASYGSWQKTYGFHVYPLVLSKYGVLPNEQQLAAIEARIKKDGVKYIVYESNLNEEMSALFYRVANDLGLSRVDLSNLSALSISQTESGKDYLSIMYENLAGLQTMKASAIPVSK
ncbi:MAG: zinc ABC transporter solute-binding protein [Erysipelotrichaceae bacterium]|jgi:ABC-type Zn uptake system ZnuABC Zn-binding protein ZnuA|nr:zinc ABC transporter solute-binding protein [Erysipelotrichaceae bacterium]